MASQVLAGEKRVDLASLQALPLAEKERLARERLQEVLAGHRRPAVAWSGGKDSTVLLHLALQASPGILVVYNDTGVEFPETNRFVEEVAALWALDLVITKPRTTFWKVVEKYGYPILGKEFAQRGGYTPESSARRLERIGKEKEARVTLVGHLGASCCDYLKEMPFRRVVREQGIDLTLVGLIAQESHLRALNYYLRGDYYRSTKKGWRLTPLVGWTEEDIWAYTREHGLPVNPLYGMGYKRNGCWVCLMSVRFPDNHLAVMREAHPHLWRTLILKKGLGKRLIEVKLALEDGQGDLFVHRWGGDLEELLRQRPCFFDRI